MGPAATSTTCTWFVRTFTAKRVHARCSQVRAIASLTACRFSGVSSIIGESFICD